MDTANSIAMLIINPYAIIIINLPMGIFAAY